MTENLNNKPYDQNAEPWEKGYEFDKQYAENREAGSDKEYSGQYRPEPSIGNEGKEH